MTERQAREGASENFLTAVLVTIFVIAVVLFARQASAFDTLRSRSGTYLLSGLKDSAGRVRSGSIATPAPELLVSALKSQPLNPVSVNAAVFSEIARTPDGKASNDRMELLGKLGWRNTTALQNRIFHAVERKDVDQIVVLADALMRREVLIAQNRSLMNLMELTPATRKKVANALVVLPSWRTAYFQSFGALTTSSQARARGLLASDLAVRQSPLNRTELMPTLQLMVSKDLIAPAYTLWRDYRGLKRDSLINDPRFAWAYLTRNDDLSEMPFEWQFLTGSGFWTELVYDRDKIGVVIRWDRKGIPDFLSQQTYAPGPDRSYILEIEGRDLPVALNEVLAFSWRCKGSTVRFDKLIRNQRDKLVLKGDSNLACTNPVFAVSGRPRRFDSASTAEPGIPQGEELTVTLTGFRIGPASISHATSQPKARSSDNGESMRVASRQMPGAAEE